MNLVKKNKLSKTKSKESKIYINSLTPYFEFKNKIGKKIQPNGCCISL